MSSTPRKDLLAQMPFLRNNEKAEIAYSPKGLPYNAAIQVFNRRMQIVVPTHGRPARQVTLRYLPEDVRRNVLFIASDQADAVAIRKNFKEFLEDPKRQVISVQHYSDAETHSRVNSGTRKRQWILENIGATSIFQLDDDMGFFFRAEPKYRQWVGTPKSGTWQLTAKAKAKDIKLLGLSNMKEGALAEVFQMLEDKMLGKAPDGKYVHVCLSSRMGNNNVPGPWKFCSRSMHAYGQRRDVLLENNIRFNSIKAREDFYVTLRLLSMGLPNAVYYDACCSPYDYGAAGGFSLERTVERDDDQAEKLASMFPEFVTVVHKSYTHSTPRKEVKIDWQKCYKAALAKKATSDRKSLF